MQILQHYIEVIELGEIDQNSKTGNYAMRLFPEVRPDCSFDFGEGDDSDDGNPSPETTNGAIPKYENGSACVNLERLGSHSRPESSPTRSQLDSSFIERGALCVKRLRQSPVVVLHPWTTYFDEKPKPKSVRKERPDGMKLARHYQALLDSGKFESRAALARHLGVSRARVTQVLRRLKE